MLSTGDLWGREVFIDLSNPVYETDCSQIAVIKESSR